MARDIPHILVQKRKKAVKTPIPVDSGLKLEKIGRRTLVVPHAEAAWTNIPTYFRSLVFDKDGSVVSVGLPKFHDAGHRYCPDEYINAHWDQMTVSEKLDGRLIIRDVWNGEVTWRTRNALHADEYISVIRELVGDSSLADTTMWTDWSLQFELCLTSERVVIAHERPTLRLIGGTHYQSVTPLSQAELDEVATVASVDQPTRTLATDRADSLDELVAIVNADTGYEGVVVSLDGEPLARIKTRDYTLRHLLRFTFPPAMLARLSERRLTGMLHGRDSELTETVWMVWRILQAADDVHAEIRTIARLTEQPWAEIVTTLEQRS